MADMDIGPYLCSCMNGGYFSCFDRQDAIASEKYLVADNKSTFSSTIIVGTFCSSSKIHFFSRFGTDNTGSGMFGFRIFPEMRFFDFATDDTSLFEDWFTNNASPEDLNIIFESAFFNEYITFKLYIITNMCIW